MKHGHKKGKAKAPSGKKSKPATKSKASEGGGAKKAAVKAAAAPRPVNKGGDKARGAGDSPSFNNPVVATAFRRAVKKFPSAFKRLTD
jgi:hypothetical protein